MSLFSFLLIIFYSSNSDNSLIHFRPDENTVIKLKYNSDAICSGSIKQKVNSFLQFIACVEIDTKEMGTDGQKFGLGLDFE